MENVFAGNLRRLRLTKNLTQEQAAEVLGVSAQSVSRWECGNTYPDVMLLPEIARLYSVTVDDLYRPHSVAYPNYAHRLVGVYEASGNSYDFMKAAEEFEKLINSGSASCNDMRSYGVIHQYMMNDCMRKAEKIYRDVIDGKYPGDEETIWRTKHQRQGFLAQLGRGRESVERQLELVNGGSRHWRDWVLLIEAYLMIDEIEEAKDWYLKAVEKFPSSSMVWGCGGDVYHKLKQYEDAHACWDKALEIGADYYDYRYAKGFCYEEMGEYRKAYEVWNDIARRLQQEGYETEVEFPKKLARKCWEKLNK